MVSLSLVAGTPFVDRTKQQVNIDSFKRTNKRLKKRLFLEDLLCTVKKIVFLSGKRNLTKDLSKKKSLLIEWQLSDVCGGVAN